MGSLGLFAYRIGSLDKLNEALSDYGPENCRGFPRITINERKGRQMSIERQNIHVALSQVWFGNYFNYWNVCINHYEKSVVFLMYSMSTCNKISYFLHVGGSRDGAVVRTFTNVGSVQFPDLASNMG